MKRQALVASLRGLPREVAIERLRAEISAFDLADRFTLLHELGIYHHAESLSGEGSTLAETAALRAALPGLMARHGVRSLLDLPCGDFHWMSELPLGELRYLGVDIVPALIERNRLLYGESERRRFEVLDGTRDPLPRFDLVLCRDLVIHLALADIRRLLAGVVQSGATYLLISHYRDCAVNVEIASGDFRPVNLCLTPFFLPPPRETIAEQSRMAAGAFTDRALALWSVAEVGAALAA